MSPALDYRRPARTLRASLTLGLIWLGLLALWRGFDAAPWLVVGAAVLTLPALRDILQDRLARLQADGAGLSWQSGSRRGHLQWRDIRHLRLDTRLDLSRRATLTLTDGGRIRLPLEVTPPADALEAAFAAQGIPVVRHHFSLLG